MRLRESCAGEEGGSGWRGSELARFEWGSKLERRQGRKTLEEAGEGGRGER